MCHSKGQPLRNLHALMMETSIFKYTVFENPHDDAQHQISHVYHFKNTECSKKSQDDRQSEVILLFSAFPYLALSYL